MKYLLNFNESVNNRTYCQYWPGESDEIPINLLESKFADLMYTSKQDPKLFKEFNIWLKQNPNKVIRLYHGADKNSPIVDQGLLKASPNRRKSLASSHGFVYLSPFKETAEIFGKIGNPYGYTVYTVDLPIRLLKPDKDQLANKKIGNSNIGNTLADSIIYGRSVSVKDNIPPYMINRTYCHMKKNLNEELKRLKEIMDINEEYQISFNIEEFKKLTSFQKRIDYCKTHLQRLAAGSSRMVFKIDNEKVLKLAINKKGIAQNEEEIRKSDDYLLSNIVANVFEYDDNNLWLEMELAQKLNENLFKQITGFKFVDFTSALINVYNTTVHSSKRINGSAIDPDILDQMWESDEIMPFFDYIGSYSDVQVGDLLKMNSYGVVKRESQDTIVLIDYGLSEEVFDTHYRR